MCVFAFMAWTNAPSNGALSGPFTLPVTVAAWASEEKTAKRITKATSLRVSGMAHLDVAHRLGILAGFKPQSLFPNLPYLRGHDEHASKISMAGKACAAPTGLGAPREYGPTTPPSLRSGQAWWATLFRPCRDWNAMRRAISA